MVAIEERIERFYEETEESVTNIIEGSDEHLDLILSFIKHLDKLSIDFCNFNESLLKDLNDCSNDQITTIILPKLRQLNRSCLTLIGAFKTSFLCRDVRTSLKNYSKQYDIFHEIMHDLLNIRLAKDVEFDNILKDINEL
jgi:hypothetical protein